ncbi:hypothetical protein MCUN1_000355 [Malassezia cuniculi]|uniref:Apoptogenic protein 1, mitochondrial n=1 Tax=Malassezia cuniculi TaxID=948313 RepID=A0AAF0ERE0_9BASI|nr:hypothetical protein MCUN1_000355 [Malassezia cuniculi]
MRPTAWRLAKLRSKSLLPEEPPVYVGPPDRISNLRPTIYSVTRTSSARAHPYSLAEFSQVPHERRGFIGQVQRKLATRLEAAQLEARLQNMWLDQFNQRFWTDNNARFERALQEYDESIPQDDRPASERAAPFYRAWLAANETRLRNYNWMLWRATFTAIGAQIKYAIIYRAARLVEWFA